MRSLIVRRAAYPILLRSLAVDVDSNHVLVDYDGLLASVDATVVASLRYVLTMCNISY